MDEIQEDLDASHALAGLLGTIPVLCMGLFAPVAAYLSARLGTRRAMTIGLALIGIFGILRAIVPSAWLVVLLTWPVGIGMGLGNALAPLAVRETVPERPATGTGVYTTGIQIGSTVSSFTFGPSTFLLGWEDLPFDGIVAGDDDYDDMIYLISNVPSTVPEPAALFLLGLGLATVARRRR